MTEKSPKKIGVLIVEDSITERRLIEDIIAAHPDLRVVGAVGSGESALRVFDELRPDVVTMDIRLPGIDGIETTKEIMRRRPTPIVIVASRAADQDKVSFEALQAGAVSIVEKPRGAASVEFQSIAERLCRQVVLMSELKLVRRRRPETQTKPLRREIRAPAQIPKSVKAIGVVASTGGPNAVVEILRGLGADLPAPIFIVQHITPAFTESFAAWLNELAPMPVTVAQRGEEPKAGRAYVAFPDHHLEIAGSRFRLSKTPPASSYRPSGTLLFESMSREYGADCIGVLMTGMGDDGAQGLKKLRDAGGYALVEDQSTAVVFGMPGAAIRLGAASEVLPLPRIARRLRELVFHRVRIAS